VSWSIKPLIGNISSTGVYTAPVSVDTAKTVTVTATSLADPSKSASATVNLDTRLALPRPPPGYFTDSEFAVLPQSTFRQAADMMHWAGSITRGCDNKGPLYCPSSDLTRWQSAILMVRAWSLRTYGTIEGFRQCLNGVPKGYSTTPYFTDVPDDTLGTACAANSPAGSFPYIQKMWELGLTDGCNVTPRMFCPNDTLPHRQVAVFAVRARNAADKRCTGPADGSGRSCAQQLIYSLPDLPAFSDVPSSHPDFVWAQLSQKFGAISTTLALPGCPKGSMCLAVPSSRGQTAAFVVRVILGESF
jgi:hypothetical protein